MCLADKEQMLVEGINEFIMSKLKKSQITCIIKWRDTVVKSDVC